MQPTHHPTTPSRRGRLTALAAVLVLAGLAACEAPVAPPAAAPSLSASAAADAESGDGAVNQPPTADIGGPYRGTVGVPVEFDASGSTDPEGGYLYYFWDFGDSTTVLDTLPVHPHTYREAGTYTVRLWVADYEGMSSEGSDGWVERSTTVVVSDPPASTASTTSGAGAGATLAVPGIAADGTASPTTVAVTFDAVSTAGTVTVTPKYAAYAPAPAGFTLPFGGAYYDISTTASFSGVVSVCLSYDPGYYYPYSQSGAQPRLLHGETVNGEAQWVDRTDYVDVERSLVCGRVASFSPFAVGARPVPVGGRQAPAVGAITLPAAAVPTGRAVEVSATFADGDAGDTHAVPGTVIAWGDGTTSRAGVGGSLRVSEPTATAAGVVRGTHAYAAPGVYTVRVTVTDAGGASASKTAEYVVVYDPGAGFVAGSGWVNAPAGAFRPNPGLAGRASFGFVSRYQKGAAAPGAGSQLQFQAAGLTFRSASYERLVVGGPRVTYLGSGTVSGLGAGVDGVYQFQLTAYDGQAAGGDGTDRVRVRIYGGPKGLLYDNEWTRGPNDDPVTPLAGGGVQIQAR